MSTAIAGTPPLLRASLRHDGRLFAPWILITTALSVSSVLVYPWIFPSEQDRTALATAIGANPALGLIFGPAFDLSTTDGFNAWRSLALGGFLTALGVVFLVTRATRAQEDSGQAELLASGVMGRAARLMAGVWMCLALSVVLGVVVGVVTASCGGGWNASMLLGATMAATGWMFTGVAAITAQLGSDVRTANSLAVGTLGALFVLRGVAYAMDAVDWTIWINPLGWMTQTKPAVENDWWPLLLAVVLTAVLLAVAFALQARRDFGGGAVAPRPGPARGRERSTLRLALRVNRAPLITWALAFVGLGFVFGYFTTSIKGILEDNPAVQHVLAAGATSPGELISAFVVTVLSLVGILAAIPGIQIMLKVRAEELADRVEPLLAGSVPRARYYGGNVVIALLAPAVSLLLAGLLIATLASTADIGVDFGDVVLQAAATIPAVWTVVAFSVFVIGARPQVLLAAWLGVLASFALTLLGPTFKLWDGILAISPFWHVPNVTDESMDGMGLVWTSLVTLLFLVVGFAGFRRRDLAVS
ncbi:ABC transporter permease [Microbacterium horticulturae]|uniref:ABC transporter permease n=1 Tax=Microbacterium horticulturae TaxID=3028316 RepID=A0ABY8C162_9MICO|nr:ABC transporter permease [Microbacterium sp. KACC 23027]WEG09082.1 ABC transporter permease [Microbacterium sp. KACC 23027]